MALKAIFPGTFDPIHYGHIDIVKRGCAIFDEVIVAVYNRPLKDLLFSRNERIELVQEAFLKADNVIIKSYDGLTVDFARDNQLQVIIRGLRAVSDFEYEFQLATMNRHLTDRVETVFLTPTENFTFVSSSLVREVAQMGGDVSAFVHPPVAEARRLKFGR